jgi:nicotinamidase/pyrazinamidase
MSKKKVALIGIDYQRDFCDPNIGTLYVKGADEDAARLAKFFQKNNSRISEAHFTLDSHQVMHIAHGIMWVNSAGKHPGPFTIITAEDVKKGTWRATHHDLQTKQANYVETLNKNGRYPLCIWPVHCLIGTDGHTLVPAIAQVLYDWERDFNHVNFVAKGSNMLTEHYSAVQADVPDDDDDSTKLNTTFIDTLSKADEILITGEALSHCVANTITDVANNFGDDNIKKFVLLTDTSSNVPNFEKLGEDFVRNLTKRGMRCTTTKDW